MSPAGSGDWVGGSSPRSEPALAHELRVLDRGGGHADCALAWQNYGSEAPPHASQTPRDRCNTRRNKEPLGVAMGSSPAATRAGRRAGAEAEIAGRDRWDSAAGVGANAETPATPANAAAAQTEVRIVEIRKARQPPGLLLSLVSSPSLRRSGRIAKTLKL